MINENQMVVVQHLDDLKLSHVNIFKSPSLQDISQCTWVGAQIFGNKPRLNVSWYKKGVHDKYLYSVLQELLDHLGATVATLASEHLFKVCDEIKIHYLPQYQAQIFHHKLAHLRLISNRECLYIYMAVAFITTCVEKPDQDN